MAKEAELQRKVEELRRALSELMRITAALNSTFDLDELLELITGSARGLLHAERGSLLLLDEETGELTFRVSRDAAEQRVPAGQGIAGWVAQAREPVVVEDPRKDERFYGGVDEATGFETRNLLAVPLQTRERAVGVLEVINKEGDGGFSQEDLELAQALANQAAIAIENARLYANLADAVVTSRMSYRL